MESTQDVATVSTENNPNQAQPAAPTQQVEDQPMTDVKKRKPKKRKKSEPKKVPQDMFRNISLLV